MPTSFTTRAEYNLESNPMSETIPISRLEERPKPPRPEDIALRFSEKAIQELDQLLTHYPDKKSCILPALWIAQREYDGFLSAEAMAEVAIRLDRSLVEIEGVATFYTMYNTAHPVGKHMIEVCTCLTCMVCGAYEIAAKLKEKLGIAFGETTPDGLFTIHEVECLDACDRAPVFQVGDQYLGPITEGDLDGILDELRSKTESTVVRLADEIVRVQLGPG